MKNHRPTHECGVFAVFGHADAAVLTYYGLYALQHRGQESAGIVTAEGPNTPFKRHVNMGLVSQVKVKYWLTILQVVVELIVI